MENGLLCRRAISYKECSGSTTCGLLEGSGLLQDRQDTLLEWDRFETRFPWGSFGHRRYFRDRLFHGPRTLPPIRVCVCFALLLCHYGCNVIEQPPDKVRHLPRSTPAIFRKHRRKGAKSVDLLDGDSIQYQPRIWDPAARVSCKRTRNRIILNLDAHESAYGLQHSVSHSLLRLLPKSMRVSPTRVFSALLNKIANPILRTRVFGMS